MKLASGKDEEFEMTVVGYEFPHLKQEPFDADWLNIHVDVKHSRGYWSKNYPCLLTWELDDLAEWLESIAATNPPRSEKHFTEPELRFEWFGGINTLRVHLHYSLRPSWSPYHGPNEEKDLFVQFTLTPQNLGELAVALRREIKQFPVRVRVRRFN